MNKTSIEWCDYTWNPVIGCKHGCSYCYAKRLNDRFHFIPNWSEPQFFPERLNEPEKLRTPSTIFVGSMCDLFGGWVPEWQIRQVFQYISTADQHTFMFLTKNPVRYLSVLEMMNADGLTRNFPKNIMLGATFTSPDENLSTDYLPIFMRWMTQKYGARTFLSIEPIMQNFLYCNIPDEIELVIVGAMTGPGAIETPADWIRSVQHHNVFYKNSAKKILERA